MIGHFEAFELVWSVTLMYLFVGCVFILLGVCWASYSVNLFIIKFENFWPFLENFFLLHSPSALHLKLHLRLCSTFCYCLLVP